MRSLIIFVQRYEKKIAKKTSKNFGSLKIMHTFATAKGG